MGRNAAVDLASSRCRWTEAVLDCSLTWSDINDVVDEQRTCICVRVCVKGGPIKHLISVQWCICCFTYLVR